MGSGLALATQNIPSRPVQESVSSTSYAEEICEECSINGTILQIPAIEQLKFGAINQKLGTSLSSRMQILWSSI
jgi:hypothetical protein